MIVNCIESAEIAGFYTILARKNRLLVFLIAFAATFAFTEYFNTYSVTAEYLSAVNYLIGFAVLSIGGAGNVLEKIGYSLIPELVVAAVNSFLTVGVSILIYGQVDYVSLLNHQYVLMIILTKVFQISLLYFSAFKIVRKDLEMTAFDQILIIIAILLCKTAIDSLESLLYLDHYDSLHLGIAILSVVGFIVTLLIAVNDISEKTKMIMHADADKEVMRYQIDMMKGNIASQQELARMRHDVQHLLNLAREGRTDSLESEAENLQTEMDQKILIPVDTMSIPLNQVLNLERQKATARGIHMNCRLNITEALPLSEDEVYLLMINLLDNAIDHIGSEKEIAVSAFSDEEEFSVSVINSIDGKILDSSGKLPESKAQGHGYGMMTISRIVRDHHGYMKLSDEDNHLAIRILFSKKISS